MKVKLSMFLILIMLVGGVCFSLCISVTASEQNSILGGINIMKTDVLGNGLSEAGYQKPAPLGH